MEQHNDTGTVTVAVYPAMPSGIDCTWCLPLLDIPGNWTLPPAFELQDLFDSNRDTPPGKAFIDLNAAQAQPRTDPVERLIRARAELAPKASCVCILPRKTGVKKMQKIVRQSGWHTLRCYALIPSARQPALIVPWHDAMVTRCALQGLFDIRRPVASLCWRKLAGIVHPHLLADLVARDRAWILEAP